jgi:hypothetical protein
MPFVQPKSGQVEARSERVSLDADESSVAPGHVAPHANFIGRSGRAA